MGMKLKRLLVLTITLALAGCGKHDAAVQRAAEITQAQVAAAGGASGAGQTLAHDDAKGCKDKAKAQEVIAASKLEDPSKMIKLIADGMKDQTCRGFAQGLPVTVDKKEGDLACIRPGDDPENKQCFWIEAKAL